MQNQYGFESEGNASEVIEKLRERKIIADLPDIQSEALDQLKYLFPKETTTGESKRH